MAEGAPKPPIYDYEIPEGMEDYLYANNIVVSHSEREFFVSFVCARPYEKPRCVARVIIGPETVRDAIAVFSAQLEKFIKKRRGESSGSEGQEPYQR